MDEATQPGAARRPAPMLVLVANEPPLYRELIARAIQGLRPSVAVQMVDVAALHGHVARRKPQLVICSRDDQARALPPSIAWVVLYPEGAGDVTISVDGQRTTRTDLELGDLLALLDQLLGRLPSDDEHAAAQTRPDEARPDRA